MFITFEGPDGVGKTTIIKMVAEALNKSSRDIVLTREPGGVPVSEAIRGILLSTSDKLTPETEVLLHFAARQEHIAKLIKPKNDEGAIILCDRFYDSTMAYQHYGLGVSKAFIHSLIARLPLHPDLTILLTAPWEVCQERRAARKSSSAGATDRYEEWQLAQHRRVYDGYHEIAAENSERIIIQSNTKPIELVVSEITGTILPMLNHQSLEIYPANL